MGTVFYIFPYTVSDLTALNAWVLIGLKCFEGLLKLVDIFFYLIRQHRPWMSAAKIIRYYTI